MKYLFASSKIPMMVAWLCLMATGNLYSQFVPKAVQSNNTVIQGICDKVEPEGWLYFKPDAGLDPETFFDNFGTAMGLGEYDAMVKTNEWYNEGQTHIRFMQYHKGIQVMGGEYTMHLEDCNVKMAHGKIVEQLDVTIIATVSETIALQAATNAIGATTYAWQDAGWEADIKEDDNDPNATWFPSGELVIYGSSNMDMVASNYNLAYRFEILAIDPHASMEVWVDAHNGNILIMEESGLEATGTCSTLYNGSQVFQTDARGWPYNDFVLKDKTRGEKIHTKKYTGLKFPLTSEVDDDNNAWGTPDIISTSAHWAAQKAWDYFLDDWGMNGWNGLGRELRVWAGVTEESGYETSWKKIGNKQGIYIAFDASGAFEGTLDIVGHEYAHGVITTFAGLKNNAEARALNESFADILGTMVQKSVVGSHDWTLGEDKGTIVRDLGNPNSLMHPDTYEGPFWVPNIIHDNAGVQNRWFTLLTDGGTLNGVNVAGIGIEKAIRIVKGNLLNYMQSSSKYADARIGAIATASAIWGPCSNEVIQTTNAWSACGVGSMFSGSCPFNISGPNSLCTNYPTGTWMAEVLPGNSVTWQFPTWWNATISGDGNRKLTLNSFSSTPPISTSVVITATSSTGQSDTHYIWVSPCLGPPCPDGGDRSSNSSSETNSKDQNDPMDVNIFPNPSTGNLFLSIEGVVSDYEIEIGSMLGIMISKQKGLGAVFEIDLGGLQPGMYILTVSHPDFRKTTTFVKR